MSLPTDASPATPGQARVDLAAIAHNITLLRRHAPTAELMAVVKADAYGHGLVPVARAALAAGASRLGTAVLREALDLRAAGVTAPILTWIITPGEPLEEAVAADVELSAAAAWLLDDIAAAARRAGRPAGVHLKIDTGMSRGGATAGEWPALLERALAAQAEGAIRIAGLWSHLACADIPGHPAIEAQLAAFEDALAVAEKAGVTGPGVLRHIANSAATVALPQAHYDMVRPGIAVYGLSPIPELGDFGLRPAMTLTARLAMVKRVPRDSGVSYGHLYVTDRETTLGLVPLGYADGVMRAGTNRAQVWAAGRRRTVAGRICMDQFVIDLGDDPASVGDEVVLFGPGTEGEPTAQEWADSLGTITHEIVTRIGSRVPRVHH
ncbi:alanine racemase [Sphaerisporangium melleum]|uniref:Alanine racemase n=1 Tax=Sphaerisporangium melleum TaxID=321316 RepID=A0A917QYY0_9ACTN|nr:alanine racemase [Sphaerisporangium melleum]GGK77593.1 alanine racemase [Sphaerisporangium melleum]GII71878.1 alanine racemase [Sphaerisporangium melleum]